MVIAREPGSLPDYRPLRPRRRHPWLRAVAVITVLLTVIGFVAMQVFLHEVAPGLGRDVETIPYRVHATLHSHHATYAPLRYISPYVQHAIIAIEDRRFYQHHGIDTRSVIRAFLSNLMSHRLDQGGSTLTEQLVKRALLQRDNTLQLKLKTMALAWSVEQRFDKARILELYLNAAYYGRGAYGIAAAARRYFGRAPGSLDVANAAFLAALPQRPSVYGAHPYAPPMQYRWKTVIRYMAAQGYITASQEYHALHEPLRLAPWHPLRQIRRSSHASK